MYPKDPDHAADFTEEQTEEQVPRPARNYRSRMTIKYVRYLLLLMMVMVALLFLFANRNQINGDNFRRLMAKINIGISAKDAEIGEVRFDSGEAGSTVVYKDGFAHASVEKLVITDKTGTEFQNTALGFRKPVLSANDRYVLVYDSGGTGLLVADSFSVLFEKQMENPIITAKMNENGYLVVVTEGDGFLAKVYVYDASFREIYRYRSLSRYILDAALSSDNKALALSAMNIEGSGIVPEILYFKLDREEVVWSAAYEENPCIQVSIKNDGTVCGLFSWGMVSLSEKGTEYQRYQFDNQVLQCYSLRDSSVNVFVISAAENGDATVVVCDEKGKVKNTVPLSFYVTSVDYKDGRLIVLGNQRCQVFNGSGKVLLDFVPERASAVYLMGKSTVVVVSDTKCVYNEIG